MSGVAVLADGYMQHPSFSPAVAVGPGRTVYVAGQLPLTAEGVVVGTDIDEQVERVWTQIEAILAAAGAVLGDVVSVRAYTVAIEHVGTIVAAREARFAGLVPPASALVVVAGLAAAGALVEIEAVAVVTDAVAD